MTQKTHTHFEDTLYCWCQNIELVSTCNLLQRTMVNHPCLKPLPTCRRPLTATGKSSNPAFMPTCHSPVGFLHCSGIFRVRPVSPTISRGSTPLPRVFRTVEVSTSPLPDVSIKSTIFGRPSSVVLRC